MDDIETGEKRVYVHHKRAGRRRKKKLYQQILQQMEFYFSDANLTKDRYLSMLVKEDPCVDLDTIMKFNKIRALTLYPGDVVNAVKQSTFLELSEDETKVRRTTPICLRENVDDCTIYVERIPTDITHDGLSKIFSRFGKVEYVSIPKFKHNKMIKGFAFVEFDTEAAAQKTLDHFVSIGCKLPSQMPPDKLCSIRTYIPADEGAAAPPTTTEKPPDETVANSEPEAKMDSESDENTRKRSLDGSASEEDAEAKKPKVEAEVVEVLDEANELSEKKRRRRKKKNANEIDIKEIGLQVLSKKEWKRLRNKYLDLQREKMHNLKAQLNRARFANQNAVAQNNGPPPGDPQPRDAENGGKRFVIELGTMVRMQMPEPCIDVKSFRAGLRTYSYDIGFVDVKEGSFEAHLRFGTPEAALKFLECPYPATMEVLVGDAHAQYEQKAANDRKLRFQKCAEKPKMRGRDKLLKRAEKELGKHIRFYDTE